MFTTIRFFYPHGIEEEAMDNTCKEFDNIEKAIKYAHRYAKGLRFAGVQIEDEKRETLYELLADGKVFDYRENFNE